MTVWQVTFDRSSLSLPDLVISSTPGGTFWLPEDGFARPARALRKTYAPDSAYASGRQLLAAVEDAAEVPLTIYAQASSAALLEAAVNELEEALGQWSYDLTVAVDGQARTYHAEIVRPAWFQDSGMVKAHMARATVSVPVNP